jgi:hypothetical protein
LAVHEYYDSERIEIDDIAPAPYGRVLEIGAANLILGRRLLKNRKIESYDYIEPVGNPDFFDIRLRKISSTVEAWEPEYEHYDAVIALDVLEHLADPYSAIHKIGHCLRVGGHLTLSVPNVSHYSVIRRLLCGQFQYTDSGILDKTHLRFFTPRTVDALCLSTGLQKERCYYKTRVGKFARIFRTLRCYQYLSIWRKPPRS